MHLTGITVDHATANALGGRGGWHETLAYGTIDPTSLGIAPEYLPQANGAAGWGASTRPFNDHQSEGRQGPFSSGAVFLSGRCR
jgi:hypothetical protein